MTKRQVIESFRQKLKERQADSNFTNQFLYGVLLEQAKWLIKREISSGRIYSNTSFFQTLGCVEVIEVPSTECCDIQTKCTLFRTKHKLPEMWIDNTGPVIQSVTSIDGTTEFFLTTPGSWQNKRRDPYVAMSGMKYAFVSDNYLWFPDNNPRLVNIPGFYLDDVELLPADKCGCNKDKKRDCLRFLDTKFMLPDWLEAEMYAKALQQLAAVTLRAQEDADINKNPNRKN